MSPCLSVVLAETQAGFNWSSQRLSDNDIVASVGSKGDSYDMTTVETVFRNVKANLGFGASVFVKLPGSGCGWSGGCAFRRRA